MIFYLGILGIIVAIVSFIFIIIKAIQKNQKELTIWGIIFAVCLLLGIVALISEQKSELDNDLDNLTSQQ